MLDFCCPWASLNALSKSNESNICSPQFMIVNPSGYKNFILLTDNVRSKIEDDVPKGKAVPQELREAINILATFWESNVRNTIVEAAKNNVGNVCNIFQGKIDFQINCISKKTSNNSN